MARKFERFSDVSAHIGAMVLSCSYGFPKLGPYGDDHKQNIEVAFDRLREGFPLIAKKVRNEEMLVEIDGLVSAALAAYRAGDNKKGAHLLQDILNLAHPTRFKEYAERKGEPL